MATREVHAVCTLDCPDSCGVLVTVDELTGRAVKVQGDPAHPVTRGFLCGKVAKYLDRVYSPQRLLYPMRRKTGVPKGPLPQGREAEAFERISWDAALDAIAARLQAISEAHGPESILPYSYAGTTGQLGYGAMDRRFFYRLGASQLDRTICASAGTAALNSVYGTRLGTAPQDFAHAGLVIAWGANIHGNNIHLWPFIEQARRNGAKLVVIDPYRTRTAALADDWLAIRPGTDVLLALAIMHVLFRDGLEDREYLATCTHGWAELRQHALRPEHAPARAAEITGIEEARIERLARAYGQAGREGRAPAAIRLNYGIQRSENGGTAARCVAMLPLLTGAWKERGGGLLLSTSGAFAFNAAKLQMPELMLKSPLGRPGRMINMNRLGWALTELGKEEGSRKQEEGSRKQEVGSRKQEAAEVTELDHELSSRSKGEGAAFQPSAEPPVKALFVYNCNPAAVAPDSNQVLAGLRRDDLFTVVHEQFFTDTADYADIVLPATTFLEHKELMGAYGHYYAQLSEQAIEPLGEARPNPWLFAALGRRMGFTEAAFQATTAFQTMEDELIAGALDSAHPWMAGVTPAALAERKQMPLRLPRNAHGEVLPFSDPSWFQTASKAELLPVPEWHAPEESRSADSAAKPDGNGCPTFATVPSSQRWASVGTLAESPVSNARSSSAEPTLGAQDAPKVGHPQVGGKIARFPLEFLSRKADSYMNTTFANLPGHQTMERRTAGVLEMHETDAAARGIATGDALQVWNARGCIELVARVGDTVASGVVAARLDWGKLSPAGGNVNALTSQRLTDLGGGATFYSVLVEVARLAKTAVTG